MVRRLIQEKYIGRRHEDLPHEPQTGLRASREGEGFVITGKVEYLTLAPVAGAFYRAAWVP